MGVKFEEMLGKQGVSVQQADPHQKMPIHVGLSFPSSFVDLQDSITTSEINRCDLAEDCLDFAQF